MSRDLRIARDFVARHHQIKKPPEKVLKLKRRGYRSQNFSLALKNKIAIMRYGKLG